MGNVFDVVLTVPHADYSPDRVVEAGLRQLGFWTPPDDPDPVYAREQREVWVRLQQKMPARMGWDDFKAAVLALPWHRWPAPTHLQVLWSDDHTSEDDSWGGRRAPYAWVHETWELP